MLASLLKTQGFTRPSIYHLLQLLHGDGFNGLRCWFRFEDTRLFREWIYAFSGLSQNGYGWLRIWWLLGAFPLGGATSFAIALARGKLGSAACERTRASSVRIASANRSLLGLIFHYMQYVSYFFEKVLPAYTGNTCLQVNP